MSKKIRVEQVLLSKVAGGSEAEAQAMAASLLAFAGESEISPAIKGEAALLARRLNGCGGKTRDREEAMTAAASFASQI